MQWDDSGMLSIYQLVYSFATIHCTKAMKVALEIYSMVRRKRFGAVGIHILILYEIRSQLELQSDFPSHLIPQLPVFTLHFPNVGPQSLAGRRAQN